MFLKSIVLLVVAVAVIAKAGVIPGSELDTLLEPSEYQMTHEEQQYDPEPVLVHLRERRQAQNNDKDRGSVGADVNRGPDGTRVRADADYNIHTSKDGRTSVDARAGWERTYHGPRGNSRPDYNVGVGFRHRFGRN